MDEEEFDTFDGDPAVTQAQTDADGNQDDGSDPEDEVFEEDDGDDADA